MRSDSRKGNNQQLTARRVFDEMTKSEFEEYRSPNRILEVTIHKVYYPLSESVLRRIFGQFGKVEDVSVCMSAEHVEAQVTFQSKLEAAEAFGSLHGRNIYDGCCQMEIKWGLCQMPPSPAASSASLIAPSATTTSPPTVSSTTAIYTKLVVSATSSSSSAPTPTPEAQGAVVDNINNTTPTRCSTQVLSADTDAPAFVTTAPTVFLIDVGEKLVQRVPVDTKSVNAEPVDRISFLPDVLLGDIISRLPVKDAVRTAVLSRRWRPFWHAVLLDAPSVEDVATNNLPTRCCLKVYTRLAPWPSFWFWKYFLEVHMPTKGGYVSAFPGSSSVVASLSYSVKYGWVQWEIPWPPPTQRDMHIASAQLRPIPWPSYGSHTVALQLGNFLLFHGLHLYFKLMVSQHNLQAILVALGFQSWLRSFTLEIHIDVSDWFQMNQSVSPPACSLSAAVTIGTDDNSQLDPSKCAILWLPECCDCEAGSVSSHWMILVMLHEFIQYKYYMGLITMGLFRMLQFLQA